LPGIVIEAIKALPFFLWYDTAMLSVAEAALSRYL